MDSRLLMSSCALPDFIGDHVPSKMVKFSDLHIRHLGHSGDQASDLVADPSSMVVIAHRFHTSTGAETEQTGGHSTLSTRP
jgi:hypothetical protein